GASTTPPSPALASLATASDQHAWDPDHTLEAEMLSGHVEGRLLSLLVKLSGARRVLDVGTFTGYSALAMAEALHETNRDSATAAGVVTTGVVTCELDADVAAMASEAFRASPAGDLIRVEVGPAVDTLQRLADAGERFDLAFLDADKPGYLTVFHTLLDRSLVGPGALIVADNTLLQGEPYGDPALAGPNGRAIAEFNAAVADDPRVEQVLLSVRDGVTLARVRDS
ncbi:MAG: class I SAM-dependent methyltransferase, partial [Actinomycetota bacterium]